MLRNIPTNLADFFSIEYLNLSDVTLDNPEAILDYHFRKDLKEFINIYDFKSLSDEALYSLVENFLAKRWEKIRQKPTTYPHVSTLLSTEYCSNLAEKLGELTSRDEKECQTNRFTFLMPTVRFTEMLDPSCTLSEIFLTDDNHIVVIDDCLRVSKEKKHFCYLDPRTKKYINLTDSEIKRIKHHSAKTSAYYFAVEAYIEECCIDSKLEALIYGLLMERSHTAVIEKFELFLEELKKIKLASGLTQYDEFMKLGHRVSMPIVWNNLKNNPLLRAKCIDNLKDVRNFQKNHKILVAKYPELSTFAEKQIEEARALYCDAIKTKTLQVNCNNKYINCIGSFSDRELREIFLHPESDVVLIKLWSTLTHQQKNQLVGILSSTQLSEILSQQIDLNKELQGAIRSILDEMEEAGGEKNNFLACQVLNGGIKEDRRKATLDNLIGLTVIAHRTAVGIREPWNVLNLRCYAETVNDESKKSKQTANTYAAGMSFISLTLYGVMAALILLATSGIGIIPLSIAGAVIAGLGGTGFTTSAILTWKRPPLYKTMVSAMSFLKSLEYKSGDQIIQTVAVKVDENIDPKKLPAEAQYKLGV